jgi:uncharacterized protein YgbK (DUF1537 family)
VIGTIADDVTGGTDVAATFRRQGLRTLIVFGSPAASVDVPAPYDAVVVALKTRTVPAPQAVSESLQGLEWLRRAGADRIYLKVCSTFDSTPRGNIGPVLDGLADAVGAGTVLLTPSTPAHGRTQYLGHLFVGDVLLSESSMRQHPLTPMTDSLLTRVLQQQTSRPVGLVPLPTVRRGPAAIRAAAERAAGSGRRYLLVDAVDDADLRALGAAVVDAPLVAGAAGLAAGLAAAVAPSRSPGAPARSAAADPVGDAPAAVLAGSCSARTLEQVDAMRASRPSYRIDPRAGTDPAELADRALDWYDRLHPRPAPLVYSSLPPGQLAAVQAALGVDEAAELVERTLGVVAAGLVARGVRRIVAAGGETAGAVVAALGVTAGEVGPEAAPGVPWIYATTPVPLALLLKSGNFGTADLLLAASSPPTA